jgi:hypothetical protein
MLPLRPSEVREVFDVSASYNLLNPSEPGVSTVSLR